MLQAWVVIAFALCYLGLLFVIASYGDEAGRGRAGRPSRLLPTWSPKTWAPKVQISGKPEIWRRFIYPLSLAIYCTSWTFFGSVGLASRTGFDFLTIYIGPILVIGLCSPLIHRIVRLAKAQNITSIADFIAARYGKAQSVAAAVALIAIIGTVPYIALQLKAVSSSLTTVLAHAGPASAAMRPVLGDIALYVAAAMAIFAVLFGTRHIDATEHQDGLMLAIATESLVKLVAFVAVGVFVTFWMFGGPVALFAAALAHPQSAAALARVPAPGTLAAMTLLSLFAIVLLPRQFHVTVVENNNEDEIARAAWLFPLYLVLINLFVLPIALAGLLTFPDRQVDSDMFVLALPLAAHSDLFTIAAFVGGLSAATAMVIVESVALAIMVSNDIVMPLVLQRREAAISGRDNVGGLLLAVRRAAIFLILFLAYVYYRLDGEAQLASIGLLSFAAIVQLAPAFFGGLLWRRATARGALAGMTIGILAWGYTLLLPSLADAGIVGRDLLAQGPWGIAALRPQALLGLDLPPLAHGVTWTLSLNLIAYVLFSLTRAPASIERLQADVFVAAQLTPLPPSFRLWRSSVTVGELTSAVARYLGEERTRTSFDSYAATRGMRLEGDAEADFQLLRYAEHLLASAIGAASSRLALSLLLRKRTVSTKAALKLLDDASAAIHYNREILQTALDHVRQGIAVFDKELHLVCWNRQFGDILALPAGLTRVGTSLEQILRFGAERSGGDPQTIDAMVRARLNRYLAAAEPFLERFADRDLVMEVRASPMPDEGIVTTFTDITPSVKAAEALERANESLERRVQERTEELTRLNRELARAKAAADAANVSKTRFLAAASHDILQPLNAARLYVTSLFERQASGKDAPLIGNIDASLDAVEEIFGALLDISRLDSGAMQPEITVLRIDELLRQLEVEFAPLAQAKGLRLRFVACSLAVRSDRRLLLRLLQNLVSNAIKYTIEGRVLVGCRRRNGCLRIDVCDTGLGIPASKQQAVFQEFHRLERGAKVARGLGLGLSIVERIARVLDHRLSLISAVGRGTRFSLELPLAPAVPARAAHPETRAPDRGRLSGVTVLCLDNDLAILDGMEQLLGGWGCRVLKAPDLAAAMGVLARAHALPNGLLVDYHLDDGDGIAAIGALRRRFGAELAAILITADRSPRVRADARANDIQVLNKPLKPAALRALLTQWRVQRVAAAE
jgi:Na+/proline symporter/signal transduction histidine kinase/CheY-like chemotaxis protein